MGHFYTHVAAPAMMSATMDANGEKAYYTVAKRDSAASSFGINVNIYPFINHAVNYRCRRNK